jgi:hypothetical protein
MTAALRAEASRRRNVRGPLGVSSVSKYVLGEQLNLNQWKVVNIGSTGWRKVAPTEKTTGRPRERHLLLSCYELIATYFDTYQGCMANNMPTCFCGLHGSAWICSWLASRIFEVNRKNINQIKITENQSRQIQRGRSGNTGSLISIYTRPQRIYNS